jgi:hypothetical protein
MSKMKYFAILAIVMVIGLWINVAHHVQISREWQNANLKFHDIETQLERLQSTCDRGR